MYKDLFYTWNAKQRESIINTKGDMYSSPLSLLFDETLRDGIQAPAISNPDLSAKCKLIDHMANSGIMAADLGYPGSNETALKESVILTRYIKERKYSIKPAFAGRTTTSDIASISKVAEVTQEKLETYGFIAVSPIRQYVQNWDIDEIENSIKKTARECREGGTTFVLTLEDSSRCPPTRLKEIYNIALECQVARICLCDTVGAASPQGVHALTQWTNQYLESQGRKIPLEWHGHNDRGMAVANSLAALDAGCSRIHGTILGIGERAGNASLDQIVINLSADCSTESVLQAMRAYARYAQKIFSIDLPSNYPGLGKDVFTTSAGVHAAAILKAHKSGNQLLKDMVYSSVPASRLGRKQMILIDEAAGVSNVEYWFLERERDDFTEEKARRILAAANSRKGVLTDEEIATLAQIN